MDELEKVISEKMEELQNCTNCPFIPRVSSELSKAVREWMEKEKYIKFDFKRVCKCRPNRKVIGGILATTNGAICAGCGGDR